MTIYSHSFKAKIGLLIPLVVWPLNSSQKPFIFPGLRSKNIGDTRKEVQNADALELVNDLEALFSPLEHAGIHHDRQMPRNVRAFGPHVPGDVANALLAVL